MAWNIKNNDKVSNETKRNRKDGQEVEMENTSLKMKLKTIPRILWQESKERWPLSHETNALKTQIFIQSIVYYKERRCLYTVLDGLKIQMKLKKGIQNSNLNLEFSPMWLPARMRDPCLGHAFHAPWGIVLSVLFETQCFPCSLELFSPLSLAEILRIQLGLIESSPINMIICMVFHRFVRGLTGFLLGLIFWSGYMKEWMSTTIILEKKNVLNWMMILMAWVVGIGRFTRVTCFLSF